VLVNREDARRLCGRRGANGFAKLFSQSTFDRKGFLNLITNGALSLIKAE